MTTNCLDLETAKHMVRFGEMYRIFYSDWYRFTHIETAALSFLIDVEFQIFLPNVKDFTDKQRAMLKSYQGFVQVGCTL